MTGRRNKIQVAAILVLVACLGGTDRLWAGSVTAEVKKTVENVVGILKDPRLQLDAKKKERRERVGQKIRGGVVFPKNGTSKLGPHSTPHDTRKSPEHAPERPT